jgi:hypothetical protein
VSRWPSSGVEVLAVKLIRLPPAELGATPRAVQRMRAGTSVTGGEKGKAATIAAKAAGIEPRTLERAVETQKKAPDLAEEAKKGEKK